MSVLSVTPRIALGRTDTAQDNRTQQWGLNASYHAVVTLGTTEAEVLAHPDVPALRTQWVGQPWLRVVNRNATRLSPLLWEVQVQYQTPPGAGGGGALSPLLDPPIIEFSSEVTEEDITEDVNGQPILFVTGEEPSPRLKREFHTPLVLVKRNVAWVDPSVIAQYRMVVNSDMWYGNPPGTCLLRSIKAVNVPDEDFDYWTVDAAIAIRRGAPRTEDSKAWYARVLAQGFLVNEVDPVDNETIIEGVIATKNGQPVSKPVLHDIEYGLIITNNADAEWYEFEIYESLPFAALGLL